MYILPICNTSPNVRTNNIDELSEADCVAIYSLFASYASDFEITLLCNVTLSVVKELRFGDSDMWTEVRVLFNYPIVYTNEHREIRVVRLKKIMDDELITTITGWREPNVNYRSNTLSRCAV